MATETLSVSTLTAKMIRRPSAFHLNGSVFSIAPKERQTSKLTFESTNTWTGMSDPTNVPSPVVKKGKASPRVVTSCAIKKNYMTKAASSEPFHFVHTKTTLAVLLSLS
ncbi:hypothetical protein N7509_000401 [Penicillium cosmopolitanum]|uniref:Uncharacterized protein n=1 Tax=Penicillium cosmopolitanum TaxID=1131564 RepID=A0A9W9WAW9_9EURO|nr:uncharacterized protein N7509_000401 [Penicillium cosmopolitanum]KAJ5413774.1 hypothetical protein N7509_000401 [Penicillium cosmopolitanum]